MVAVSIIILTKNEERNIERTLKPLMGLSDDILVFDNGSTDQTRTIAEKTGAKVIQVAWQGYSATKNNANALAKYDWILSLDADEEINQELNQNIQDFFSHNISPDTVFLLQRKLVYAGQVLHYGSVSTEYRLRLFNRKNAHWNQNAVHEDLEFLLPPKKIKMKGFLWHHSYNNRQEHEQKVAHYAALFAKQNISKSGATLVLKQYLSPIFGFIKNYIFRFGFMDGYYGFQFALVEMKYTYKKYQLIHQNNQG